MNSDQIYSALTEIFNDVFFLDDITLRPEMTAKDIEGWDSYKQIEILVASEERFGIKFTSLEVNDFRCLGDLAALIQAKILDEAPHA